MMTIEELQAQNAAQAKEIERLKNEVYLVRCSLNEEEARRVRWQIAARMAMVRSIAGDLFEATQEEIERQVSESGAGRRHADPVTEAY